MKQLKAGITPLKRNPSRKTEPQLREFEYLWKYRRAMERNTKKDLPSGLSIVFGVTIEWNPNREPFWNVIEGSWMQQRGVCTLGSPPRKLPGCVVYVTRVVGQPPGGRNLTDWAFLREDKLELSITENMDEGKTFYMFHALARAVPWATHIAKV